MKKTGKKSLGNIMRCGDREEEKEEEERGEDER